MNSSHTEKALYQISKEQLLFVYRVETDFTQRDIQLDLRPL